MKRNKDGSYSFKKKEIQNPNNKMEVGCYTIDQYDFHLLIKKTDSQLDVIANQALYVTISVVLQFMVLFVLLCYYKLTDNKDEIESTLSNINAITIGLFWVGLVIWGILKIISHYRQSERKLLISKIKSHLKEE